MCGGAGSHDTESQHPTTATSDAPAEKPLTLPEHLYLHLTDAHCHIQDDRDNIRKLVQSWSPSSLASTSAASDIDTTSAANSQAPPLLTGRVCLMGVQPSKDLGLHLQAAENDQGDSTISVKTVSRSVNSTPLAIVTWNDTDTKGDWDLVSSLARDHPDRFVPCFGIHPWFTHKYESKKTIELPGITGGGNGHGTSMPEDVLQLGTHLHLQHDSRFSHYQKVLSLPNSLPDNYFAELAQRLPEPRALEPALEELKRQLEQHPHAILGEIGLDRTARILEPSTAKASTDGNKDNKKEDQKRTTPALTSIQHQLDVVRQQLKLAASLKRAVSFHCVQAYGHWHDFLIQEGKRLKQMEADQGYYQQQLREIHESGGTAVISPVSPSGIRLSKKTTARLKREAKEAAWERHVASTLQESSDEDEDEDENRKDQGDRGHGVNYATATITATSAAPDPESSAAISITSTNSVIAEPAFEAVLPPRLCMHSYGGSVDMIKAFTKLDHPPEIFFSFSILVNGRLQERKLKELILAVPEDRLLIESDHHSHLRVDRLLVEMVHKVAEIRQWTVEETVMKTSRNWQRFVYG
ncbi:hypothetical protein BGZ98_006497 [Dissophora globulifera]|nr:hypothetical protein BGZ98_006497 [Dissophora globulifera]